MIYSFGDVVIDTLRAEVRRSAETVPLRHQSFEVLVHLAQRPHRVVSKEELLDAVWGDKVVTDGSLKHCMREIRLAIGDHEHTTIRTVPRHGYIFEAPVKKGATDSDSRKAVLIVPIKAQGLGSKYDYLADGLTEEIITELSKSRSIRVISRASAMRLKKLDLSLQDVARELGVDFVLDGSFQSWGDSLRIGLQLVDVESEEVRWSNRYSGTMGDLFSIQDEIARSVAHELAARIVAPARTARRKPDNPRAVESYFRARTELWKFTLDGLQKAERYLLNGLDYIGPDERLLAELGHTYARYNELGMDPTGAFMRKAAECADRIFELDPESPRGLALLGLVQFHSGELREAHRPLERALKANPSDPDTLGTFGYLSALRGQNQRALQLFHELILVDPLTPINVCMPGFVAIMEGRNSDALPHYRQFFKMDPHNAFAAWALGYVLLRNGRVDEASEVIGDLQARHPDAIMAKLGCALLSGVCGKREAARAAVTSELRAAAQKSELLSREITHSLALAGETDDALDWLENTVRIGNINYPFWAQHNRWVDSIRGDRRFDTIMRDVEREWLSVTAAS